MAFDLVQYFAEQIKLQKPQLFNQYPAQEKNQFISEINALTLGKLITLIQENENSIYQEIQNQDALYIQEISRHLTTSAHNQSELNKSELESAITEMLSLQLNEIKQLDTTGSLGHSGVKELLIGQIEHLSGYAEDWVWSTNNLLELKGSKPLIQEEISLDETMKEFNLMVHQQQTDHAAASDQAIEANTSIPAWAKIAEPLVALVILWILYQAATQMFS